MTQPEIESIFDREHASDVSDQASQRETEHLDISLREHARKMKRDQEPDKAGNYTLLDCVECGSEIGLARIKVAIKNTLCIHCATLAERR